MLIKPLRHNRSQQLGFSLIEILAALMILAFGLMGLAALQFKGLKYNHDAYLRSQISFLAYDIADRMRLNRPNLSSYVGNYTVTTTAPTGCTQATGADATNDLACWRNQVFDAIPPGSSANISAAGDIYTVTLGWTDRGNTTHNIDYTFQP